MIPILYDNAERRFITNGYGRLSDCTRCIVTEERNGVYECEFDYPITGERYEDIQEGRVVMVSHDDTGDLQPFDIYGRSAPISGIVTFYAHHISYRLSDVVVEPFTASGISDALTSIGTNSINANEFSFWTDKTGSGTFTLETPDYARAILGGQEGSILDVYGAGDYEFDRFTVKLHADRGTDSGVEIRYGKNLADLTQEIDTSSTYNAVVPFWLSEEGDLVMLPEKMLVYSGANIYETNLTDEDLVVIRTDTDEPIEIAYRIIDAIPLDLSSDFEEQPTEAELRAAAQAYLDDNEGWIPDENIEVDFVQMWQTDEYAALAPLQRVRLCDTVSVYYPELGVEAVKTKVIKTVYNVLLDRYDSIELGKLQTTLAQTIASKTEKNILAQVPTFDDVDKSIDLIRGGLGGYVVINTNANGEPQEILIMDQPDKETAVNVIRMNKNGIGFSQSGYNGPFNSAWTIDGTFMAEWIKAGILSDNAGKNYWNLDTGALVARTIEAIDYIYMDGDENSYFKIPYLGQGDNYIELSYNGLVIKVGVSEIINTTLSYSPAGATTNVPYGVQMGALSCDYSNSDGHWQGIYGPTEFSSLMRSGNSKVYETVIRPGYFTLARTSTNRGLTIDTVDNLYFLKASTFQVDGALTVTGTKSRKAATDSYGNRLLYCYETPTPLFGDIGEAVIDEDGFCYVDIDDIFSETIAGRVEYQVFLQKEGAGDCWVADKARTHFVIEGTPGLRVAWELKAKQRDYELLRLEDDGDELDVYEYNDDYIFDDYLTEQEGLLYGDN